MASIRRQGEVFEIRECVSTEAGPRQRALARFRKVLTPTVLDRAEAAASRPFDREALVARARARGIAVATRPEATAAHRLLAQLRSGRRFEPALVGLLRESLDALEARALPEHLDDASEWIGRSESERGRALRGLLRSASRVARSRIGVREPVPEAFPRFSSGRDFA